MEAVMRQMHTLLAVLWVALLMTACAARPRQTPLPTTPVEAGSDTLSGVRKQLEGRWVLLSLKVIAEDGREGAVPATGTLTSDASGVVSIEYRMEPQGQKSLAAPGIKTLRPVISTSGRVVIDPQSRQITYVSDDFETRALGFDPDLAAQRANPFALERARYYVFGPDGTLTLTTRHDSGKDASVSHWKKSS
jgi:hypothetical protein